MNIRRKGTKSKETPTIKAWPEFLVFANHNPVLKNSTDTLFKVILCLCSTSFSANLHLTSHNVLSNTQNHNVLSNFLTKPYV